MIRLLSACAASLLLYAILFGTILDRPLSFGFLQQQIEAKLARGAALPSPKLVILAGSNGPYSHRCEVIESVVRLACVNGGVAVGIGLDYLFARWLPLLRPGDVVYLPMEEEQYTRGRATMALGPDAAIMFRHDRRTLMQLSPRRWIAAMFSFDLRSGVMSVLETALALSHFRDPRMQISGSTNAWGDHIGHTRCLAAANRAVLAEFDPHPPDPARVRTGYGAALIAGFTREAMKRGVTVIGGLPAGFADVPVSDEAVAAIRNIYQANGGGFIALPNRSRYPRECFFDSPEHLTEECQVSHSVALAEALKQKLGELRSSLALR
ncbi:MAG: hypothetical protein JOY71_22560 [Acetobacteraceae bacterium]|nr:hypothetical protein [Acetobacteraceae bacterium]